MAFFSIIRSAYDAIDRSSAESDIKLALMHGNYLDCNDAVRQHLQNCRSLCGCDDPLGLDAAIAAEVQRNTEHLCNHSSSLGNPVFTCCPLDKYLGFFTEGLKSEATAKHRIQNVLDELKEIPRHQRWAADEHLRYNRLFDSWLQRQSTSLLDVLHWLSDRSPAQGSPCANFMELGLVPWGALAEFAPVVVIEWPGGAMRKPTWLDNKLTFYFDGAPADGHSGWTRNLYNGEPGRREWVAKGSALRQPFRASLIQAEATVHLHLPPARFWSRSVERLLEHRTL